MAEGGEIGRPGFERALSGSCLMGDGRYGYRLAECSLLFNSSFKFLSSACEASNIFL